MLKALVARSLCFGLVAALSAGAADAQSAQSLWALRTLPLYSPLADLDEGLPNAPGQTTSVQGLSIRIIDGEGAINNIKGRTAREIIVQVEDRNHNRVPGAVVMLTSPTGGPSGTFAGESHLATLVTDKNGRAVLHGFRPNHSTGKFQIHVTASLNGEIASAVITETNQLLAAGAATGGAGGGAAAGGTAAGTGLSAGAIAGIVGGVVGAVTGITLGVYHAQKGSNPTLSIGVGGGLTVGPPH